MGIAGLVLGIIALLIGWIPGISILAVIMAIVGLVLAIVDVVKKSKANNPNKGPGIAGIIVSAIAFIISGIMTAILVIGLLIYGAASNTVENMDFNSIEDKLLNIEENLEDYYLEDYYNHNYNYNHDYNHNYHDFLN